MDYWKKHKRAPEGALVQPRRKTLNKLVEEGRALKVNGKFIPIVRGK